MKRLLGVSWKTTLVGYVTAILIAVQPLMTDVINWDSRHEVIRYFMHLVFAAAVAFFGKYAADSAQVKTVAKQVDVNTEKVDEAHEVAHEANNRSKKNLTNANKASSTRKPAAKK